MIINVQGWQGGRTTTYLNIDAAAAKLGIEPGNVFALAERKEIEGYLFQNAWRNSTFNDLSIDRYLEKQIVAAEAAAHVAETALSVPAAAPQNDLVTSPATVLVESDRPFLRDACSFIAARLVQRLNLYRCPSAPKGSNI